MPPSKVSPARIPEPLEQAIMSCLAKSPAARSTAFGLAKQLRAIPPAGEWTEDQAVAWWSEFRKQPAAATHVPPAPTTITIDVGQRT